MNLPETDLQPAAPVKEPTQRIVNTIRSANRSSGQSVGYTR